MHQGPKFTKAFQTEDNEQKLSDFLNVEERAFIFCPESLKCETVMPKKVPKGKTLVFMKVLRGAVTADGIAREVMVMEMGGSTPFEHLELLAHEIFLPILSNAQNQAKWGEVPTREIMDRFYGFLSSTTILCGQIKGETRLPMPPMDIGGASSGKNRISLLEGAIITWTKQIKSVLKQDPESQLKQGMHPTPDVEIDFWKNKVFTARLEANDNMKYLRTLEDWFDKLNDDGDFPKLLELFKPMLHIILLIWKNSKHYNTPARLVVLMREICNSLIIQACKYSSGQQIFTLIEQEDAAKAVDQLKTTLLVCGTFKSTYFDYKATANAECPANPWRIQNNALFMRLDSFLERCHDILDLTQTIVQFGKLAKIEVGGTKGNTLTASVKQIHLDFEVAVEKFKGVPYDILDVAAKQFDDDFYEFRCSIKELERRLGAVVSLAFDDCATVYGRFKLLDSFEGLLERPIIQDELEKKYVGLVQSYGADLRNVQELFLQNRDGPPISWNLPPIAGALTWCRGLVDRIQIPMAKLQQLDRTILDREEAKEVAKVYATIIASLQEYENQKIEEWGRDVEASSQAKLKLPLLIRDLDKSLLNVNFDPALVKLLREVKYFLLLGLTVPDSALEVYKQVEIFRRWTGNLDLIVNMNNDVLLQLLPVEKPLVRPYLDKFDRVINAGLSQMNWNSVGINEFIEESMEQASLSKAGEHTGKHRSCYNFHPPDSAPSFHSFLSNTDLQVTAVHEVMHTMKTNLANIKRVLGAWDRPLMERKPKPVDRDEFERAHKAIKSSRYAEIKEGGKEIHNMLKENNKVLKCSNASPDWRGYVDFVNNVVVDGLSRVICASLEYLLDQIGFASNGKGIRDLVHNWVGSFFSIATLFKRLDNEGTYIREMQVEKLASLDTFMRDISTGLDAEVPEGPEGKGNLMKVMKDISEVRKAMDTTQEMFEPLHQMIVMLKQHGVDVSGVQVAEKDVQDFLEEAPMSWDALVKKTFRKKEEILPMQMAEVDALKEELEGFFLAMRSFRNKFRAEAPFAFKGPVEDAYKQMEEHAASLLEKEVQVRRYNELEDLFELQVSKYPETQDTRMELRLLKGLWDSKAMVDSTYVDWRTALWSQINTEELDDENKVLLKQLRKQGNDFPVVKGWAVYRDIEDSIKNMGMVLPLINDLHSPAMRVRHWKSLAAVCEVKAVNPSDPKFTMDDMMQLNLHAHVEDVSMIVETAQKELKIENKLEVIEAAWRDMELHYVPHKDTEMFVVRPSEELVESLEAHQMELQSMVGMGKFVDFFRDRVMHWQKTLGSVEEVLKLWANVSRNWASLESIFLASADIRSQLPDDTKRFEGIDSEFKELMKEAINVPMAVDACGVDGRAEGLKSMMQRLEMCQKSLNEYLDMKKKIFPRFYFVSNVALLDMLANGTNPPKIMPYLGDCYDSLANLTFITLEDGTTSSKTVNEMVAKDREHVKTFEDFTMEGEVEGYLNRLSEMMVMTLKLRLNDGIDTAVNWEVEKPRHKWLFDYPAQVVLTGTQIYWTEETEAALEEFEGGQEDAVKRYLGVCNARLACLIDLVLGELKREDRTKIISLITLDVHARDVVQKLINDKTEGPAAFLWQQQLRFYWAQTNMDVDIRICDFRCKYFYEWIGNTGRLVITPLTDRCYITLTMGLRLFLGGAPAGPAGTGKTETTKDLARALALPCYVFNCSDQMNYQTMADIFRGLAQTGAWGCFDEFNRIPIEVLSVVATQVKTVQDAIVKYSVPAHRDPEYQPLPAGTPPVKVGVFDFMGDIISLIPTCGFYITMNPGYAGRTELPENLKALFRSCAMIRPDLKPICENMLMSEGFQKARTLAIKFVTLYELSSDLLSKQFHYDWGLRAVKSVLRMAGMLKRGEPNLDEAAILMRALRDFNTPKIPAHDTPIFLRLIADLFMGLEVATKMDETLKQKVVSVSTEWGLQIDDTFVLKTVQFQELLDVRHSVMLLGPAGCGKSTIWKTLAQTHNMNKPKKTCVVETVNPKAVTGDELYGYMTLAKDWKDGVLSIVMRGMSKNFSDQGFYEYQTYKWVVLDGDIDAVWIESMNTVMDDNKVLTLVSNERVPLSDAMRMVFEINSLKNATPATVSRAGILFINETATREDANERQVLPSLFEKYVEATRTIVRKGFKEVTPLRVLNKVCTIVYLLEGLLEDVPPEKKTSDLMEQFFVFALMWAFGGPMVVDKSDDYRRKFSEEFLSTFAGQKIPKEGTCFDYFYDWQSDGFKGWSTQVPDYQPIPIGVGPGETPFSQLAVSTNDTVRMSYIMNKLVRRSKFLMLVGTAGTGKTSIIKEYLRSLDKDADGLLSVNINMNYFTDSAALQQELEMNIDKRSGRRFGPPTTKRLITFLDDMNLPYVETYGTQNAIALLTQIVGYGTFFDRVDLGFRKEIVDVQFLSAMNPTAGSFEICERLQRHFATFACQMPSVSDLKLVYSSILSGHMLGWGDSINTMCARVVDASIFIHSMADQDSYSAPLEIARLWVHECERVFRDRIISASEMEVLDGMMGEAAKKHLSEFQAEMFKQPVIFTTFCGKGNSSAYTCVPDAPTLKNTLDGKLQEYNESNPMMDLVLFDQAMEHVTRICRIIQRPSGNAMLIGVGGSGKQSLSRLAAFICGFEVRQLSVTSKFKVDDLKEALQEMFKTAGVKGTPLLFLMTDGQIVNERFLIYINDILANGWISDLFPKDEREGLVGALRNEAKAAGIPDTPEAGLEFLISRIKSNLHVALCFSPVGDIFRIRARRFPGLINCTSVDFFHPWPRQALISVAARFLDDVELGELSVKEGLAVHMAEEHLSVTKASTEYYETQRRYNYVTPKSYLELIGFYKFLLDQKRTEVQRQIDRLDVGLSTLRKTAADVAELQVDLTHTMVKVEEKKAATEVLLEEMGVQRAGAEKQQAAASIEADKASVASAEAAAIEKDAEKELAQAEPAMLAAAEAVNCLSKAMLTELKSLPKPPAGVTKAVLILVEKEYKNHAWDRAKKMMANVDHLMAFRGEDITEDEIKKLEPIVGDETFTVDNMKSKSAAAANLCSWVISIYTYNRIYVKATEEKAKVEAEAAACLTRLSLAERLVGGLSSENERWGNEIEKLRHSATTLVGDCMLASGFVSYVGAFDQANRDILWKAVWTPDIEERKIPLTPGVDPLDLLTNDGNNAKMTSEGLPADRISLENGSVITNCKRWPLIIDPQQQGIKWLRKREEDNGLSVIQLSQKKWLRDVETAIMNGQTLIIENIGEEIDPTLDPVLARAIYKKGRSLFLKLGGEEVEYDPGFQLYLQTKLSNPHYKPEIAAQAAAKEIAAAVEKGKLTEIEINVARELYRKQATEGAMLYFLLTKLCLIDHMYQYSLDSFVTFFLKSITKAKPSDTVDGRVLNLRDALRMTIFTWVSRGLFERHKLIFLSQLAFNLMKRGILGEESIINEIHFQFLLRGPRKQVDDNPLPWLPEPAWQGVSALGELEEFAKFSSDLVEAGPRFREWFNHITPETEKLPLDWASLDRVPFQKMLVVRCLRPDRMNTALSNFIRGSLPDGNSYADCDSTLNSFQILEESFLDSTTTTPIYFILSPGANVVGDLDKLADKYEFVKNESYHNVSMGQGQDVVAMSCLELAHRNGHWVILNNIHLMPSWLIELEKKLDEFALEGSHEKFRLYLSSDPSNAIPIGVLSRCIKLTNEPPAGLKANLKRAFANFSREYIEEADSKTKSILFGLCHFHAIMMERKLYGPMGFNMMYPFSIGDLRDSAVCLTNYMENSGGGKIPWQDLKYIFGEIMYVWGIMYGGHIVNDFDRLLANEYLDWYMKDELLDETELYPFAEDEKGVSFLTLMELQPRDAASGEGIMSPEQMVGGMSETILDKFGEKKFDVEDIGRSLEEAGPYQNVFMQEMDVMNTLLAEIVRSLKELQLGFAGELTMSDAMEGLMDALYLDKVPATWAKRAWPSLRPLASWLADFTLRLGQLEEWQNNPMEIPKVTWISGLVNPQSFLTAICQVTAQKNQWELDKLQTQSEMLKKFAVDEVDSHSKEGAYIIGLSMQGARWDPNSVSIEKSKARNGLEMPKEMFCSMPIMSVKGVAADRVDTQGIYLCPCYKTEQRGPTYVFSAQLKTKSPAGRWVLAGVALIMDAA
ncbi:unnamed protein product [Ectocarpus sp. CCAP 1310/34]|nr:unnamed protein product [Ectocarpus sp. CCAP 1310/34]